MEDHDLYLVTRGDDAGFCHTANIALRDAVVTGILRNVSVMVPAPAFDEAAQIFSSLDNVTLGLHVDLTAEWEHMRWGPVLPAEKVPSLVDNQGMFYQTCIELMNQGACLDQMKAEVQMQLTIARESGLNIQYVDEHMGVGVVNGLGCWLNEFCVQEGLVCNRHLFQSGKLQNLPHQLDALNPVDEVIDGLKIVQKATYLLVGHPAYLSEEMLEAYLPGQVPGFEAENRNWQRRMFMDEKILNYCNQHQVIPLSYMDIK